MPDLALNNLPVERICSELGPEGWKKIEQLTAFLYSPTLPPTRNDPAWRRKIPDCGRFAPSIVSRSEIEIFGISTPRFCYRLYFEAGDAFVNVRRLDTFRAELAADPDVWRGNRDTKLPPEERHPRISRQVENIVPPELLSSGGGGFIIADCLLQPPGRYSPLNYHLISAALHREYGEVGEPIGKDPQLELRHGTPYVKTVSFGGGLCAQACCFVATAILHEHAKGVFGLGEITALASAPSIKELLIAGLDETEMMEYFKNIGLRAVWQFSNPYIISRRFKQSQDADFKQALRGYVSSGMPVILTVDIGGLNGEEVEGVSIYEANNYHLHGFLGHQDHRRHAVTVVGCSRLEASDSISSDCHFLLMDSSAMPFMQATLQQLAQVGTWRSTHVPPNMRYPALIPVTPSEVKMPLLCWGEPREDGWEYGLIEFSKRHPEAQIDPKTREFILTRLKLAPQIRVARHFGSDYWNSIAAILREILPQQAAAELHWSEDHWVWLECGTDAVNIWDAEIEPGEKGVPYDLCVYLRATIRLIDQRASLRVFRAGGASILFDCCSATTVSKSVGLIGRVSEADNPRIIVVDHPRQEIAIAVDSTTSPIKNLEVSAISSFTVLGAKKAASAWEQTASTTNFVELYTCMQGDMIDFFPHSQTDRKTQNVVRVLAGEFHNDNAPEVFAEKLKNTFGNQEIVAFATFIPEIMSLHERVYRDAQRALMFLVETARHLGRPGRVFTIEMVAGSRLHGVWRAESNNGDLSFAVNRRDSSAALQIFLERLEEVAECASREPHVQLAVEFEPGPLFTIGSRESLFDLCFLLEGPSYPYSTRVVGVNLDVPHWDFLGGISLEWLEQRENQVIRDRIIHAHISDHSKGHFCDNIVGVQHSLQEFSPWVDFLKRLSRGSRSPGRPQYSGYISCEMEACKSSKFVDASVKQVQSLLH